MLVYFEILVNSWLVISIGRYKIEVQNIKRTLTPYGARHFVEILFLVSIIKIHQSHSSLLRLNKFTNTLVNKAFRVSTFMELQSKTVHILIKPSKSFGHQKVFLPQNTKKFVEKNPDNLIRENAGRQSPSNAKN